MLLLFAVVCRNDVAHSVSNTLQSNLKEQSSASSNSFLRDSRVIARHISTFKLIIFLFVNFIIIFEIDSFKTWWFGIGVVRTTKCWEVTMYFSHDLEGTTPKITRSHKLHKDALRFARMQKNITASNRCVTLYAYTRTLATDYWFRFWFSCFGPRNI